eukprot:scaffold41182_cov39-Tisochrysis_lutea.AAC.5
MDMILTEVNVMTVMAEAERELGTMFGSDPQSAKVGITGKAEFVELDGPIIVIRLSGRFWHARSRVLERLEAYILERIPEAVAVEIEDPSQLEDALDPETGLPVNEVPGLGPPPPLQLVNIALHGPISLTFLPKRMASAPTAYIVSPSIDVKVGWWSGRALAQAFTHKTAMSYMVICSCMAI